MTPEERIAVLESQQTDIRNDIAEIKKMLGSLLTSAAMGKGAWWLIMKIGGVLVGLALIWSAIGQNFGHWWAGK